MHIRKLNNKGFAITGVLYTLFVMFLLLMFSVLSGLRSKKNLLEKVTNDYESIYCPEETISEADFNEVKATGIALVTGKYIFLVEGTDVKCSAYLKKGTSLTNDEIIYTPKDCNDYEVGMELKEVYSFEKE